MQLKKALEPDPKLADTLICYANPIPQVRQAIRRTCNGVGVEL